MPADRTRQRNVYRGLPARAWVAVQLISASGSIDELNLVVDTGNPCAIIVDSASMQTMRWRETVGANSNFGMLEGGWLRIVIPELQFDVKTLGYANDSIVKAVKRNDAGFGGLLGLPFLRMLEYGGDQGWFWIQSR